ncbi:MAG: hypothetical protein A2Y10_12865 [Planctomycetes bacterium GWF2_41_51]|nr:MAG: hypothetical protein A2Y10_12865 [Planctomycetes bacterium GWF2_41_51]HBG28236.1 hypothetical protein [Phycisphaerales bacterium]
MKMQIYLLLFVACLTGISNATVLVHYNFDDISGTTVTDTASGLYDATLGSYSQTGQTGSYTTVGAGKYDDGIGFYSSNGSGSGGWALADTAPVLGRSFTFSFWINTDRWTNSAWATYAVAASGAKMVIYSNTDAGVGTGLTARLYDYSATDAIPCVTSKLATMGVNAESNVWHHVAAVVTDLADITLYVDGVQYLSGSSTSGYGAGTANMDGLKLGGRFGANGSNNKYVSGSMDDFAIFDTALNAEQIADIYESSMPIPEPATMCLLACGLAMVSSRKNGKK